MGTNDWRAPTGRGRTTRLAVALITMVIGAAGLAGCLTTPGDLAGTARNTDGDALSGITVTLYDGDDQVVDSTLTDADGAYGFDDIGPGYAFTLGLHDGAGTYLDWWHAGASGLATATPIAVGDGATTVVDATMITSATAASITGTVTDATTSNPIQGLAVSVLTPGTDHALSDATVTTDIDGTYSIAGLSPGEYVVRFGPTAPYGTSYDGGARSIGTAASITVAAGAAVDVDAALPLAGSITGQVMPNSFQGMASPGPAGVTVIASVPNDLTHPVASTVTTTDGFYVLAGLAPGSYLVGFIDPEGLGGARGFAPALYKTPRATDPANATLVAVPAGAAATATMVITGADCDPVRFPTNSGAANDGADLRGERLAGCFLGFSMQLDDADLSGADLRFTRGFLGSAEGASFVGARLADSDFGGDSFAGADFTGADLRRVTVRALYSPHGGFGSNLNGADFTDADLTGARITDATLTGIIWSHTTCSDGTDSDANGGTCVGHLVPG